MDRHGIATADELRRRAVADPDWFYPAIVDDLGIEWFRRWDTLRDDARGLPWTEWFLGGQLNLVLALVANPDAVDALANRGQLP